MSQLVSTGRRRGSTSSSSTRRASVGGSRASTATTTTTSPTATTTTTTTTGTGKRKRLDKSLAIYPDTHELLSFLSEHENRNKNHEVDFLVRERIKTLGLRIPKRNSHHRYYHHNSSDDNSNKQTGVREGRTANRDTGD